MVFDLHLDFRFSFCYTVFDSDKFSLVFLHSLSLSFFNWIFLGKIVSLKWCFKAGGLYWVFLFIWIQFPLFLCFVYRINVYFDCLFAIHIDLKKFLLIYILHFKIHLFQIWWKILVDKIDFLTFFYYLCRERIKINA